MAEIPVFAAHCEGMPAAPTPHTRLAEVLLAHRRRIGAGQETIAAAAGISAKTLGRIERAESVPRMETLLAIADAMKLPRQVVVDLRVGLEPLPDELSPSVTRSDNAGASIAPRFPEPSQMRYDEKGLLIAQHYSLLADDAKDAAYTALMETVMRFERRRHAARERTAEGDL